METIFVLLLLASLIAFVVGMVKPSIFFKNKVVSRKKVGVIFGGLSLLFFILVGVTAPSSQTKVDSASIKTSPSASLQKPTVVPTATSTTSLASNHGGVLVKVVHVVDGDTIKVETGETVRYIGIDSPETVDPRKPVQCYGKEASDKNKQLVEGKIVELEKDISEKDKYGRLLRYIWLGESLINEVLVRDGYAHSSSYPPDVKYQSRFVEAERLARQEQKGLWGSVCSMTPTPTVKTTQNVVQPTTIPVTTVSNTQPGAGTGSYTCNCSKTCAQMSSCAEAQYQLNVCGCSARDADKDGTACDSDCQ
ncbi:MAG: thermonuclease family protein [Candidatus Gottesmanbacteria bacterium]|nr:thermonuclease family protein [Candidatus Gottesmanbacteria bacterium]